MKTSHCFKEGGGMLQWSFQRTERWAIIQDLKGDLENSNLFNITGLPHIRRSKFNPPYSVFFAFLKEKLTVEQRSNMLYSSLAFNHKINFKYFKVFNFLIVGILNFLIFYYLENFAGSEHALNPVWGQEGDPPVHELEQDLEVRGPGSVQDNNQLTVQRRVRKYLGKVCAACCQNQPVRFKWFACKKNNRAYLTKCV